jgi:hypothetical protein
LLLASFLQNRERKRKCKQERTTHTLGKGSMTAA